MSRWTTRRGSESPESPYVDGAVAGTLIVGGFFAPWPAAVFFLWPVVVFQLVGHRVATSRTGLLTIFFAGAVLSGALLAITEAPPLPTARLGLTTGNVVRGSPITESSSQWYVTTASGSWLAIPGTSVRVAALQSRTRHRSRIGRLILNAF